MGLKKTVSKDRKIYGQFKVYSPDRVLMFHCGKKKVDWYLKRDLAEKVSDNVIRLTFQPKGYGNHNDEFGLTNMENRCVNCGEQEHLTRHHIVPYCYRRHFPLEIKSHDFHDIVAMCASCHESYERSAFQLKTELAETYKIPVNGTREFDRDTFNMQKKLFALQLNNVPMNRKHQLKNEIKQHFGWKRLTEKRIKWLENRVVRKQIKTHGELLVEKLKDFDEFIILWRKHFLRNNKLEFLPETWSVDYKKIK